MVLDLDARAFWATLDHAEREDREAERNVRPPPTKKPPRHDLRRHRMDADPDPDTGGEDRDLSLNYKVVGARRVQRDEKKKRPGDYWQTDQAWGVWPPDADHPTSAVDEEHAKAIADGEDEDYDDEKADPKPSKEDKEVAQQKRLENLRKQFRDTLKTDLGGDDHPYVKQMLDLPDAEFDQAMKEFGDRVNFVAKQVAKKNFGWVADEVRRAQGKWRGRPNAEQLGATVAALALTDSLISDPDRLGGVSLQANLPEEARTKSARASFNIYRQAGKELRQKALNRSAMLLQEMGEDHPRRANLEARIDGLALACYLEGEDPVAYLQVPTKKVPKTKIKKPPEGDPSLLPEDEVSKLFPFVEPPKEDPDESDDIDLSFMHGKQGKEVRLRPEMAPSFGKLVKVLAKAGRAETLLVPPDEFFGPAGRSAMTHALQEAEDEDLVDLVKDGPFEDVGDLLGEDGPRLGAGQKAVLRDAIRRIVLEDATTVQAVLNATSDNGSEKRRARPTNLRARAAKKAKRDEKVRAATKDLLYYLRANPPDREAVEAATSNLILAGMKSLDEVLKQLFDSGEVEPLPPDDPHLAKVRHAIKTGDLSVLWKKVVDPDSIRPLSGTPAQEDSSMSEAKRPAPPAQKKATLSPLVIRERRKLAAQLDQCVMALQQNQADLGIAPGAVQAFTQVADLVADHLDGGQAALAPSAPAPAAPAPAAPAPAAAPAQPRQAAQRRQAADWDPENIGREVSGPLEDLTPNDSTFTGEFTMQENRELGDDYEAGKLDPGKTTPEPRAPRPGIQASMDSLKSLEVQARTLRKSMQAGILAPSEDQSAQIAKAAALASSALRKQVQAKGK